MESFGSNFLVYFCASGDFCVGPTPPPPSLVLLHSPVLHDLCLSFDGAWLILEMAFTTFCNNESRWGSKQSQESFADYELTLLGDRVEVPLGLEVREIIAFDERSPCATWLLVRAAGNRLPPMP